MSCESPRLCNTYILWCPETLATNTQHSWHVTAICSVTVRWSFLCSLFCFLGMIASRMFIEFDLLSKQDHGNETKQDMAMLVLCSLGALATHLLSYVNQNLWCWQSILGMTCYLVKVGTLFNCISLWLLFYLDNAIICSHSN